MATWSVHCSCVCVSSVVLVAFVLVSAAPPTVHSGNTVEFRNVEKEREPKSLTLEKVQPAFANLDLSWHVEKNKERATLQTKAEPSTKAEEKAPANTADEKLEKVATNSSSPQATAQATKPTSSQQSQQAAVSKDSAAETKDPIGNSAKDSASQTKGPSEAAATTDSPTTQPPVTYSRKGWLMPYEQP